MVRVSDMIRKVRGVGGRKGPGLKPLYLVGLFAGLKPCAPSESNNATFFADCEVALSNFAACEAVPSNKGFNQTYSSDRKST
jgi:hypothetical protein